MDFGSLSDTEKTIVGQALRAAADGPFFPDWEFHTLFGLERSDVRAIADAWPEGTAPAGKITLAVNNSMNNLLGYPHNEDAVWSRWISVSREELDDLLRRLRGRDNERFFDRLE
jgi:hypothetical protein